MVSSETIIMQANDAAVKSSLVAVAAEPGRISFSADFMDDDSFISISPGSSVDPEDEIDFGQDMPKINIAADFEFLSGKNSLDGSSTTMLTADELFFEGKLLPCTARQQQVTHAAEKLASLTLRPCSEDENYSCVKLAIEDGGPDPKAKPKANNNDEAAAAVLLGRDQQQEPRIWFVDDDPSPRPPKCTVLWKELLRLKKQRGSSTLSPSSSTSSSSSSSSSSSLGDAAAKEEKEKSDERGMSTREKHMRRLKRGLERTKSAASIRIRPMVNVPICTHHTGKSNSLPPLFPLRKTKVER